jgi:hypothetical protein
MTKKNQDDVVLDELLEGAPESVRELLAEHLEPGATMGDLRAETKRVKAETKRLEKLARESRGLLAD